MKDLTGYRFGRLVVVEPTKERKRKKVVWLCKCDCGKMKKVVSENLLLGRTNSCGCIRVEQLASINRKYDSDLGDSNSELYKIWCSIKRWCYDPSVYPYVKIGACGIKVCDEWISDFVAFRDWSFANGYRDGMKLRRINYEKDFSPENCQWQ